MAPKTAHTPAGKKADAKPGQKSGGAKLGRGAAAALRLLDDAGHVPEINPVSTRTGVNAGHIASLAAANGIAKGGSTTPKPVDNHSAVVATTSGAAITAEHAITATAEGNPAPEQTVVEEAAAPVGAAAPAPAAAINGATPGNDTTDAVPLDTPEPARAAPKVQASVVAAVGLSGIDKARRATTIANFRKLPQDMRIALIPELMLIAGMKNPTAGDSQTTGSSGQKKTLAQSSTQSRANALPTMGTFRACLP